MLYQRKNPRVKAVKYEGGLISAARVIEAFGFSDEAYVRATNGDFISAAQMPAALYPGSWLVEEDGKFAILSQEAFNETFEAVPPPTVKTATDVINDLVDQGLYKPPQRPFVVTEATAAIDNTPWYQKLGVTVVDPSRE